MLRNRWSKRARESKGAALVEFALIAPLLLILCMAATDLAFPSSACSRSS